MNSKRKGSLAIGEAIGYFITKGYTVLLPIADCDKYDLVIDENSCLKKVQCKYTSAQEKSGAFIVDLRTFGGYREKTYHIRYLDNDFDYLFVYCSNRDRFLIPADKVINKLHLALGKKSWTEYKCNAGFA